VNPNNIDLTGESSSPGHYTRLVANCLLASHVLEFCIWFTRNCGALRWPWSCPRYPERRTTRKTMSI